MILTHGANSLKIGGGGYVPTDEYDIVNGVYVSGSGQYGGGWPYTACSIANPAKITIKTNATSYTPTAAAWSMFGLSTDNYWNSALLTSIRYIGDPPNVVEMVRWRFGGNESAVGAINPLNSLNGEHTHILDGILGKLTIDDNLIANVTKSDQTYSYIFPAGKYWGGVSCLGVKECTIEDSSGNILCEYTSVCRKSDNSLGFYSPQFGFFTSSSFAAVS